MHFLGDGKELNAMLKFFCSGFHWPWKNSSVFWRILQIQFPSFVFVWGLFVCLDFLLLVGSFFCVWFFVCLLVCSPFVFENVIMCFVIMGNKV